MSFRVGAARVDRVEENSFPVSVAFMTGRDADFIARRIAPDRQASALAVAAIVAGLAMGLAAIAVNFPLAVGMFAVAGMANGIQNVSMRSIIHARVVEHLRGRVFSAYAGATTGAQLAATAANARLRTRGFVQDRHWTKGQQSP